MSTNLFKINSQSFQVLVEGFNTSTVCGFECKLGHTGFFSVCDQPFDSARSCVGNVDNVLHNFESVPCLTPAENRNHKLMQSCRQTLGGQNYFGFVCTVLTFLYTFTLCVNQVQDLSRFGLLISPFAVGYIGVDSDPCSLHAMMRYYTCSRSSCTFF